MGRGFAYENLEKFNDAKEDILRVRQLQPDNIPAQQALIRINKALHHSTQVDMIEIEHQLGKIKD